MKNDAPTHKEDIEWVREAIQYDHELREKYQIGQRFRFIQDRLQALLSALEKNQAVTVVGKETSVVLNPEEEVLVYVYLYNAHGTLLRNWISMMTPKTFYEYSVNRPIYSEKSQVETFIHSKPQPAKHGYLTVAVKKTDILPSYGALPLDPLGQPLIKIREGALRMEKWVAFTHNRQEYMFENDQFIPGSRLK